MSFGSLLGGYKKSKDVPQKKNHGDPIPTKSIMQQQLESIWYDEE